MRLYNGTGNVKYFIWIAIIHYAKGTKKLYHIQDVLNLHLICKKCEKEKGRHLPDLARAEI